jgi:hypothetical protein
VRNATIALLGAGSALIVSLVVLVLWSLGSASGERDRFSSLEIAPRDADVFVAINTDPTSPQWLAVNDSLGMVNARDPIRRAIDEALAEVNLDWEEDILPIAGDEAFFSAPKLFADEGEGSYVAGFRIRDTGKAHEVFEGLRARAEDEGQTFEIEEYEGVEIYYSQKPDLDGDPATESDCEVDDQGVILCDGQVPIPEEPHLKCVEAAIELGGEDRAPEECRAFFVCQDYAGLQAEADPTDTDGDGRTDACEEADRMKREWELSVEQGVPYQDCVDVEDAGDPACEEITTLAASTGAVALFADVLAVGAGPDDVKAVIDVVQGRAPSAVVNERLQEFREGQKEDFLMWGYADLAPVWDMAEAALPEEVGTGGTGPELEETQPPPVAPSDLPEPDTDLTINSFDADYRVENGTLHVTERITVDFGENARQHFFRYIPAKVTYDFLTDVSVKVEVLSVLRNGAPEQFSVLGFPLHTRIQTEAEGAMISGQQTYELQYLVRGALVNVEDEDSDLPFYDIAWNVTGDNWGVPLGQVTATFTLPEGSDLGSIYCYVGDYPLPGLQANCTTTQEGIPIFHFASNGPIEPGSSMALFVNVAGESGAQDATLIPNDSFSFDDTGLSGSGQPEDDFSLPFDTREIFDEARGAYDRVGFSISSTSDGFALDLTVLHAPGYERDGYIAAPTKVFDSHFADNVPADTMFFYAGYDAYGQYWHPMREYMETADSTDGSLLDDFLGEFTADTGLDFEEDILSLLTGEYAVAGDVSNLDQDTPDFSILAMVDVADADRAQRSLDELGEYLTGESVIEIRDRDGLQLWTFPDSVAEPVGLAVEGDTLLAGYPGSAVEDAVAGFDDSLSGTDDWKRTMATLPPDTTSVGFVSIQRILEEVRKLPDAESNFEESTDGEMTLDDLTPIRSIGYASTSRDNGFGLHLVLFMEDR